jgi:hypothetical protein
MLISKDIRWAVLSLVVALVGCGSDEDSTPNAAAISSLPLHAQPTASAPDAAPSAPAAIADQPLAVEGRPGTAATVGATYSFKPTIRDADGRSLSFDIANKPDWATFSKATGQLSGTPSTNDVGTNADIVIQVADGEDFATLPTFSITVPAPSVGSATLSWSPPTQYSDGSQLLALGGYKIYYGSSADELSNSITVQNGGIARYVVENLTPGKYFFAMTVFDQTGTESARSPVGSKAII